VATVFDSPNEHCVGRIFNLASTQSVIASEDIVDANGTKLWAKGKAISPELKERLLKRRLQSPLELSLEIERSITTGIVVDDCLKLIEENPLLQALAGSKSAAAALSNLRLVKLPGPIRMLLTVAQSSLEKNYRNALYTLAISAGFASQHSLSQQELQMLLVTALLHDIGEIYINPEYLTPGHVMGASEWSTVAAHPSVGHLVARDIGRLPEGVIQGIAHHHERLDGSGYPGMLRQKQISAFGRIIAVADSVSAILVRGHANAAYQATLALKIVPEEYDRASVSFVDTALRELAGQAVCDGAGCTTQVRRVAEQSAACTVMVEQLLGNAPSGPVRDVLLMAQAVCISADKSLRSTGIEQLVQDPSLGDETFCGEVCDVAKEIAWHLRNVARNMHLRIGGRGQPSDIEFLNPLIALLERR
jgi:hypothetical protein